MREIEINVDPPEMMFVEDELMIMILDTIKIIPKAGCVVSILSPQQRGLQFHSSIFHRHNLVEVLTQFL